MQVADHGGTIATIEAAKIGVLVACAWAIRELVPALRKRWSRPPVELDLVEKRDARQHAKDVVDAIDKYRIPQPPFWRRRLARMLRLLEERLEEKHAERHLELTTRMDQQDRAIANSSRVISDALVKELQKWRGLVRAEGDG